MPSRKKLLKNSSLYLILDRNVNDYRQLLQIAKKAIAYGVDIIQLRDKHGAAKDILKFSERLVKVSAGKALYIVNDRVDIAKICGADGVHLGQEDFPVAEARKILGPQKIIGRSCQTFKHAKTAEQEKADYIGFGSVFKTLTKPSRSPMNLKLLKRILNQIKIPVFCIGGINLINLEDICDLGCKRVAVCRDICLSEDMQKTIFDYKQRLIQNG